MAPPFREAEFDILYDEGISIEGDLLDLASEAGIVEKSGSWFSYQGERIGQGRENARKFLKENPETLARIGEAVYAAKGVKRKVRGCGGGAGRRECRRRGALWSPAVREESTGRAGVGRSASAAPVRRRGSPADLRADRASAGLISRSSEHGMEAS